MEAFCLSVQYYIQYICPLNELGDMCGMDTITRSALLQVVLDCPLDACFTYIYQYEPYLKDPVGFPRVMVSMERNAPD